jgi:membrane protein DedA with SNARE-associated domain
MGDAVWALVWIALGYFLGSEYKKGEVYITIGLSIILVILVIFIGIKVRKWLHSQNENSPPV